MKQFPATRNAWIQPNTSDIAGDIFVSKSLDLTDNMGKVRVGKRLVVNTNTQDEANLAGTPVAFREYNRSNTGTADYRTFAIAGSKMLVSAGDYPGASPFAIDATASTSFNEYFSDMEIFQGFLYATTSTTLEKYTPGTGWATVDNTLDAGVHMLLSYAGRLYITDLSCKIYSWDGSVMTKTGNFSLALATTTNAQDEQQNTITWMRAASDRIWIGTVNCFGNKGYIYSWDGTAVSPSKSYRLKAAGALACVVKDDNPWIMDTFGRLMVWNGGTFIEKARLNRRRNRMFINALSNQNDRFIHPNGMSLIGGNVHVLIDSRYADSTSSVDETIPAGVWEYDDTIGLVHKYAFANNHAADVLTDFGANRIARAGALSETNFVDTAAARNGTFVAGAGIYKDATTTTYVISYDDSNDTLQKAGYLVTPKIEATDGSVYNFPTVEAAWASWYTFYRKLLVSTDRIYVKHRHEEVDPVEGVLTWTSETVFTIPDTTDMTQYWNQSEQKGFEVEIMQGYGAGRVAHITNAVHASSTWTVTVDQTFPNATGKTSVGRFENWKYLSTIQPNNQSFNGDSFNFKSQWIQVKVYALFTGRDEIERFIISNSNGTPVK